MTASFRGKQLPRLKDERQYLEGPGAKATTTAQNTTIRDLVRNMATNSCVGFAAYPFSNLSKSFNRTIVVPYESIHKICIGPTLRSGAVIQVKQYKWRQGVVRHRQGLWNVYGCGNVGYESLSSSIHICRYNMWTETYGARHRSAQKRSQAPAPVTDKWRCQTVLC